MTLNDAYLVSQIAAAILVAPTLLYLALQVRQNTAQMRAAARYQFVEAIGQFNVLTAGNRQTASVFRRGVENIDSLDADERVQFVTLIASFLAIYGVMYELRQDKLLPESQWRVVKNDLVSVLGSPGGRSVWESYGKHGLAPEFVAYAGRIAAGAEASYDMTKFGKADR